MNILYANESFAPQFDGVAVCAQNYTELMNRKYGSSSILVPKHEGRAEDDFDYEIFQCPTAKMTIANQYKVCLPIQQKMKNRIEKLPLDLVHSHCPFVTGILAMRIAKQKDIPHISTFHSKYKDDINQRLKIQMELPGEVVAKYVAFFYNKCDYVWSLNQGTAKTLKEYGYKGEITIMPNGCDMPVTYRNDADRKSLAQKYGLDPNDPMLLFVGRITYLKNVHLIVNALSALKRRGKKFSMLMVGSGEDEKKLQELVQKLGLEEVVKFTGKVMDREELRKIYSSCDLFVFPSVYDNAPLVVREAAACGVSSLLIKGSNSAEGIIDGENGILTEERVEDSALAISDALSNADLKQMGAHARDTIYITWEEVMEKAVNEYERVIHDYEKNKGKQKGVWDKFYDIDLAEEFNINLLSKPKPKPKSKPKSAKTKTKAAKKTTSKKIRQSKKGAEI
jgi:glycosyltransferase involved in cell wall biosynthesis